jgi:hypothetical protein
MAEIKKAKIELRKLHEKVIMNSLTLAEEIDNEVRLGAQRAGNVSKPAGRQSLEA